MMPDLITSCEALIETNWEPVKTDDRNPEILTGKRVLRLIDDDCMDTDYYAVAFIPTLFPGNRICIDIIVYMKKGCKSSSYVSMNLREEMINHLQSPEGFAEIADKAEHLRKIAEDY